MFSAVKQWQQPPGAGQVHSEQRIRQRGSGPLTQQNHSPEVEQPVGQPPPCEHGLQGVVGCLSLQRGSGDQQGLHGPPPQPAHWTTEPSAMSVRVSHRPAPSEPAVMNLKNWRREDRCARE
jgi:hypothetical protein